MNAAELTRYITNTWDTDCTIAQYLEAREINAVLEQVWKPYRTSGVGRAHVILVAVRRFRDVAHDVVNREEAAAINVIAEQDDPLRVKRLDVGEHRSEFRPRNFCAVGVRYADRNRVAVVFAPGG